MLDTLPPEILNIILETAGPSTVLTLSHVNNYHREYICECYAKLGPHTILINSLLVDNEYSIKILYANYINRISTANRRRFYEKLAKYGSLELIIHLNKILFFINIKIIKYFAQYGRLEIMMWLYEQGFLWDENNSSETAIHSNLEFTLFKIHKAKRGNWNEDICAVAAKYGHLDLIRWCEENGSTITNKISHKASRHGHFEILEWVKDNDHPWDEVCCNKAARSGNSDILKWLYSNGCPWDNSTCEAAAAGGHVEILKWAVEAGCYIDSFICGYAAMNGHLDALVWCISKIGHDFALFNVARLRHMAAN